MSGGSGRSSGPGSSRRSRAPRFLHAQVVTGVWVHLFARDESALLLSGAELYVIMSLSKDYIS